MCTCQHGSDRHYLDYAGPGVPGGILTRCLEKDCDCKLYTAVPSNVQIIQSGRIVQGGQIVSGGGYLNQ